MDPIATSSSNRKQAALGTMLTEATTVAMEVLVDLLCRSQADIWRLSALSQVNVSGPADKGWELNKALGKLAAVLHFMTVFLTSSHCCCFFTFLRLLTPTPCCRISQHLFSSFFDCLEDGSRAAYGLN